MGKEFNEIIAEIKKKGGVGLKLICRNWNEIEVDGFDAKNICLIKGKTLYFILRKKDSVISQWQFSGLFGNCGVIVSSYANVQSYYQKCGWGTLLNKFRILLAKEMGYSAIMCTVINDNAHQIYILKRNKWEPAWSFKNRITGRNITFYMKKTGAK